MIIKFKRKAGFWIRFLARIMDSLLIWLLAMPFIILIVEKDSTLGWSFKQDFLFYVLAFYLIVLYAISFIFIPMLFNGRTISMWICQIQITNKNNNHSKINFKSIIKRELWFGLTWIFLIVWVTIIINHTLILKFASSKTNFKNLSDLDKLRFNIATSIGSVVVLIQILIGVSLIIRKDKKSLNDLFSDTYTVWRKRYISIEKEEVNEIKLPIRPVNNNQVEWILEKGEK